MAVRGSRTHLGSPGHSWLWGHGDLRLCTSVCGNTKEPRAIPVCGTFGESAHSRPPLPLIYVGFSQDKYVGCKHTLHAFITSAAPPLDFISNFITQLCVFPAKLGATGEIKVFKMYSKRCGHWDFVSVLKQELKRAQCNRNKSLFAADEGSHAASPSHLSGASPGELGSHREEKAEKGTGRFVPILPSRLFLGLNSL